MSPSVSLHLLQTQSDDRLLALARRGHERAFEALVRRHRKSLLAYCRRLLLPEGRAEDALQQALLQAWMALERGDEVRDVRSWLFRIVHNTSVNALQRSRYDYAELSESLVGAQAPEADLDRRAAVREALAGLAALPPLQREALLRTAVEGRPHEEVAAAMGLSDGALRGLVYRARATLRSAATAITPPSLVAWVASAGAHTGSLAQRLPEAATGGGSAGVVAVLLKGGTVAVTAGALVAGATAVHEHRVPVLHATVKLHRPVAPAERTSGAASQPVAATAIEAAALEPLGNAGAHAPRRKARALPGSGDGHKLPVGHRGDGGGRDNGGSNTGEPRHPGQDQLSPQRSPSGDHHNGSGDHHTGSGGDSGAGGSQPTGSAGHDGTPSGSDGTGSGSAPAGGDGTSSTGTVPTTTGSSDGSSPRDGGSSTSLPTPQIPGATTPTADH